MGHGERMSVPEVARLVASLSGPFPGLALGLGGMTLSQSPAAWGDEPAGTWYPSSDEMVVGYSPGTATDAVLEIAGCLGHELWHRASVRSAFWSTPCGTRWLRAVGPEAEAYLSLCVAGDNGGHTVGYMADFEPSHGILSPLHKAAEEVVANRCGAACVEWTYAGFMGESPPLRQIRSGIPSLA